MERVARSGIADDEIGAKFASVRHLNADSASILHDDLLNIRADDHFPSGAFYGWKDGFGDARRAANRIAGAVEIVRGEDGVHAEAALRGREPIVAPLRGENSDQLFVLGEVVKDIERRLRSPSKERRAQETAGQTRSGTRDGFFREVEAAGFLGGLDGGDVAVDGSCFGREIVFQASTQPFASGGEFESTPADNDTIVHVGHGRPFQLASSKVIESGTQRGRGILQIANVVHADIPGVAGAVEAMRVAAGGVVALEHQNSFVGVFGKQCGSGEAADAGADNNGVPAIVEGMLFIGDHVDTVHIQYNAWMLCPSTSSVTKTAMAAKRPYHHANLKQSLLDSALGLIAEVGPQGFTLREVARRAGVSHNAPYRHFLDKDDLLAAVAAEGFERLNESMTKAMRKGRTGAERLRLAGRGYVEFAVRSPQHLLVMFEGPRSAEPSAGKPGPGHAEPARRAFQTLLDAVMAAQAEGDLPQGDPYRLALVAWSGVHGLAKLAIGGQLAFNAKQTFEFANYLTRVLMRGMLSGP